MREVGRARVSFAAPAFLWALLGVPLVVLLHFLRTERRRRDVAALFLWREARDLAEARKRMSPTWLLLVQILFVVVAALALAQPRIPFGAPPDAVLVLDASASMAAREAGGRTRFDVARDEARDVAAASGRVAVVRAGIDPVVVHPLDADRNALGRALAALRPGDRTSALDRALDLAEDIASGGRVHVFTDAEVPARSGVAVHPVGGPAPNAGIVAFDVGLQEAFLAVASNLDRPQEIGVALVRDGVEVASTSLFVPVGTQGTVSFPLQEGGIYEARIEPPAGDALDLDDVAYAGRSDLVVVLDAPNEPLQRALAALPGVTVRVTAAARTVDADVRVLTGADPEALAEGRYILLAAPAAEPEYRVVRDVDRAHPLMRFVDLRESVVGVAPDRLPTQGAADEVEPWTVLARDAGLAPLIRFRQSAGRQILQLAFHPSQTDVVLRPAFPALVANAVRTFRGEDRIPLGAVLAAPAASDAAAARRALEPGMYDVGGRQRTASLLSTTETRLAPAPPAPVPEGDAAGASASASERALSVAPWLLLAALLALAAEWLLARRAGWWALRGR